MGDCKNMSNMDSPVIEHWQHDNHAIQITYPNIAKILVQWIQYGMPEMETDFIEKIWNIIEVLHANQ